MKTFLTACMESSSRRKEAPASSRRVCNIPRSLSLLTSAATVATGVVKHARRRTSRLTALLLVLLWSGAALPARAGVHTVTSTNDDGSAGTLRQWIGASIDGDTINITVTGTINLTGGELLMGRSLTIIGPGAANLTISGNNSHRVFEFASGTSNTISGLTISNGRDAGANGVDAGVTCGNPPYTSSTRVYATPGNPAMGGGILNYGTLTVSNCVLSGNIAAGGSGGNGGDTTSAPCGDGVYRPGDGAYGTNASGGAIFNGGNLALFGCTLSGNSASGGSGGSGGPSYFSPGHGASAGWANGGAIYSTGSVMLVNCTLAGNSATGGSGGRGGDAFSITGLNGGSGGNGGNAAGGAIENLNTSAGSCFLKFCTVSGNSASAGSGGSGGNGSGGYSNGPNGANGLAYGGGTYAVLEQRFLSTIVAGNNASTDGPDVDGWFISYSYNLIGNTNGSSGTWFRPQDLTGTTTSLDPWLGPLQFNGGPTPTMALLPGSAAIDHGNSGHVGDPTTDQRGFLRPQDLPDANASGGNGADIGAYELQPDPTVTSKTPKGVDTNSATLYGDVNPNGTPTLAWCEWGTSASYGNATTVTSVGAGSSVVQFGAALAGLVPGTTYHFRAVAWNGGSTNYGSDLAFTTKFLAPTVVTLAADLLTGSSARLNGTVNPNGAATTFWFQWDTNTSYANSSPVTAAGQGNSGLAVNAALSALSPGVTYYYRIMATNSGGTSYDSGRSFTTILPPSVVTGPATSVAGSSATLNGSVNPNGTAAAAWFQWGTTISYGFLTPTNRVGSGSSPVPVAAAITGLTPGQTYHFRAAATNAGGTVYGSDGTFTALPPPGVATTAATLVTGSNATLNGSVNPYGEAASGWFEWGTSTNYGLSTALTEIAPGSGAVPISIAIINLTFGQTYHFRAVAGNATGIAYGGDQTFVALPPPSAVTLAATLLTSNSATLHGSVNPNARATTTWFEYGLTTGYGNTTAATGVGSGTSVVPTSAAVSGLSPGATYHFRVVASNAIGLTYGGDLTFRAFSPPSAVTLAATLVAISSATLNGSVNPNGLATTAWFEYGGTASYGNSTAATNAGSGGNAVAFSAALSGLSPGATYHFRAAATNGSGTNYGNDATLVTPDGSVVVWSLANSGPGSLRDAVTLGTGNPITFSNGLTGTITLTNGELLVSRNVTILGPGANVVVVSGNNLSRVFNVTNGVTAAIAGLSIVNGRSPVPFSTGANSLGGGILNSGSLALSNCLLSGNVAVGGIGTLSSPGGIGGTGGAGWGGGIFNGSNLFLYGCTFRTNTARGGNGGGGYSTPNGAASPGHGGGAGHGIGGGLYNTGAVQIVNCTFWGNLAGGGTGGYGGNDDSYSCLTPGNGGPGGTGFGGAMEILGTCTMTNCTLSGNSATNGAGGGGGYSISDSGYCQFGTNGAAGSGPTGGGLHAGSALGGVINTIIAANTGGTSPDVSGAITSRGHNLIGATNGSSGWLASDVKGTVATPTNALLGPLQDNGGPTPTLALLTGSRAIDAGDDIATNSLATDQRGLLRLFGTHVDIGAYEAQVARPTLTVRHSGNKVVLSWPSPSTGFLLLQSPGMNPPNWTTNNTTPSDNGTTKSVTNNSPTGVQLYRLKQ